MPLTMTTVTGPVYLPNGATPFGGRISFELSSWDVEEEEGLIITGPVYVPIDENGQFSVNLFTTTAGSESVSYRMFVIWEDSVLSQSYVNDIYVSAPIPHFTKKYIGSFALSGPGPFQVSDLNIISETNSSSFDAYLEMKAFADRIDLGVIDSAVAATAADRVQTGLDATVASESAAQAQAWADEAEVNCILAQSAAAQAALYDGPFLDTVVALLADTSLTYTAGQPSTVLAGDYVRTRAEGFAYQVATSSATDHHVATAGGVKLYILPNAEREIDWTATGAISGSANHGTQWAAAIAALSRAETNVLRFGPGEWRFAYVTMPEGLVVKCNNGSTVFKPVSVNNRAIFTMDSGSAVNSINGCKFEGATFSGAEVTPTFSEQKHLVTIHGVDGASFVDCTFIGWRGDAIYIGSSDTDGATERHNRNINIARCTFDGVNNENRQAISILDIDGIWITECTFKNCTKSTMPGVIDFEPNPTATFAIVKNAWIERCTFDACGGNAGTVSILFPASIPLPNNINILNNSGKNLNLSYGAGFVGCSINRIPSATDIDMSIRVEGNDIRNIVGRPYQIMSVKGFRCRGNMFTDCTQSLIIGFNLATTHCADVSMSDTFIRVGSTLEEAALIFTVIDLDMTGCVFDDCGNGTAASCAIRFHTGTSSFVKLNEIQIVSPTGKTMRAVRKEVGHTFTPETNQHYGCRWGLLFNAFESHQSDSIFTTYTPVAEGASVAGAGTYTRQYGRWRRIGRQVFFELEIVQTAHTGTGLLELSLPVAVDASSNNELRPVAVMLDGVSTTGGQIGAINPGAIVGGVTGAIRCYYTGTGTILQTVVPSGVATLRASGSYMAEM